MLDENLPTFHIKSSSESPHNQTIYLGQSGNDLIPEYTLRRPDPSHTAAKNCYALGIADSHNPECIFGEVLVRPEWIVPSLSAAELRAQNGVPPAPVPIVPSSFTIQLYNPDQQIVVRQSETKWTSTNYWEFEVPQQSFRMPSASSLDRAQDDPTALEITPKVHFKWKRDSKFAKHIACYMGGKSTDGKKSKEPDITLATFKHGSKLTVYEPNMYRVDVEDRKGLEVVMILSAVVIRDIFFDANREMFNISGPPPPTAGLSRRQNSIGASKASCPITGVNLSNVSLSGSGSNKVPQSQIPSTHRQDSNTSTGPEPRPPPADARTQWEIDAETARLKALVEAEEAARAAEEAAEERRLRKMLQDEEREARRKQAEIDAETERLKAQYGLQPTRDELAPPAQRISRPVSAASHLQRPGPVPAPTPVPNGSVFYPATNSWGSGGRPVLAAHQQQQQSSRPQDSGGSSGSGFFGRKVPKKRSVFF